MKIITYPLGQLQANCYFLIEDSNCVIIDPGDEANFILETLQLKKLKLVGLLATHGHFDHVGAVGEIQLSFDVPLYIFREDLFLIDRLEETAEYFLGYKPHFIKPSNIKYLQEGKLRVNEFNELRVLRTPGHTPGSCCYYVQKENVIFTGDTLFKQGIGRYDFSYSDKMILKKSLKNLFALPKKTQAYCGHGEVTTLGEEVKNVASMITLS